jgi:transcriptional regulator with XRE-family HTH domain
MATKEKPVDRGTRKARAACTAFGDELRRARTEHGLSQHEVGRAVGLSKNHVSRIERGLVPALSFHHACRLTAVVGLDLSIRAHPAGQPIGDVAHRALLDRFKASLPKIGEWHYEMPLPGDDDDRAWDAVLVLRAGRLAIEAETRVADLQALQRRLALKKRDDPRTGALALILADSRHNRLIVRENRAALAADFPLNRADLAAAPVQSTLPDGDALVLA